jgi:four helix bundle protein
MGSGVRGLGRNKDRVAEPIRSYKDLRVWQQAVCLVELVYAVARRLPADERYGLYSQLTRAVISVPANIAEGHGSSHRRVYVNHLSISKGSLMEVETYLALVVRLGFVSADDIAPVEQQARGVGRLTNALIRSLRAPTPDP